MNLRIFLSSLFLTLMLIGYEGPNILLLKAEIKLLIVCTMIKWGVFSFSHERTDYSLLYIKENK